MLKNNCESCIHYCEKESLSKENKIEKISFCDFWQTILQSKKACERYENKTEKRIQDKKIEIRVIENSMPFDKFMCLFIVGIPVVRDNKRDLIRLKKELKELENEQQII